MVLKRLPALVVLAAVALGLAGCGRKGGLDLPPGAALTEPAPAPASTAAAVPPTTTRSSDLTRTTSSSVVDPAQKPLSQSGFDSGGNPVAPPGRKRPFILDPLLN